MTDKYTQNMEKNSADIGLDEKNRRILTQLAKDPRMSIARLSELTGIKRDSLIYRLGKMKEAGILNIRLEIDLRKLGFALDSLIVLSLRKSFCKALNKRVI